MLRGLVTQSCVQCRNTSEPARAAKIAPQWDFPSSFSIDRPSENQVSAGLATPALEGRGQGGQFETRWAFEEEDGEGPGGGGACIVGRVNGPGETDLWGWRAISQTQG